jgi:hypothetical protein
MRFRVDEVHDVTPYDGEDSAEFVCALDAKDGMEEENDDDDEMEEEEAHPLGFENWGRTRFALQRTPQETLEQYKERWGYYYPEDDIVDWFDSPRPRVYPPIHNHHDYRTVPTKSLIKYTFNDNEPSDNDDIVNVIRMLQSASIAVERDPISLLSPPPRHAIISGYGQLDTARIQAEIERERRRLEKDHKDAADALLLLVRADEAKASAIQSEYERKESERLLREEKERQAEEDQRKADEVKQLEKEKKYAAEKEKARAKKEAEDKKEAERLKALEVARRENDFKGRAEKLVLQLEQVRASIAPFETSVATKQRRMRMKRIGVGKLNTLSEDVAKIRSVAKEVSAEISVCREEDEQYKQQIASGNKSISPEQCRGKRYFIDFVCSKVIVRIQAESFFG